MHSKYLAHGKRIWGGSYECLPGGPLGPPYRGQCEEQTLHYGLEGLYSSAKPARGALLCARDGVAVVLDGVPFARGRLLLTRGGLELIGAGGRNDRGWRLDALNL